MMGNGQKEAFCGVGNTLHLEGGLRYLHTCICQNAWDDSLKSCAFNFMQILPQRKKSK